jgi:hypothetical protein
MSDNRWAYAHEDGSDMYGEYGFMTATSREEAQRLAQDYVMDGDNGYDHSDVPPMVVYEIVRRTLGKPVIVEGEDLGDGDREPDELTGLVWVDA